MCTFVLGESGGVIEMADLSSMDPTWAAGEALAEIEAARALTEARSVPVLMGEDMRPVVACVGYCPGCTTVLMGDARVLYDRIGEEATSQMEWAGETFVAPTRVDFIGDADGDIDQTDFNGEAVGVVVVAADELEREPSPHFVPWPGTVIGAADHAW